MPTFRSQVRTLLPAPKNMEGCPAGDAGTVLNAVGGSNAQGFDYAILPPKFNLDIAQPGQRSRLGSERSEVRILLSRPKINADIAQMARAAAL